MDSGQKPVNQKTSLVRPVSTVITDGTAIPVPQENAEISRNRNKGNFDKSGLKLYISSYRNKVQTAKRKDSLARRTARHEYLKDKLANFDKNAVEGLVFVDLDNADTWYKMQNLTK